MDLVTIATFPTAFTAHVIQGRLDTEGIESYLKDEHTIQVNPFYSNALGGIKLQVKDTDVAAAVLLLRQSGYRTVYDMPPQKPEKQSHILVQFGKFLLATAVVLGWLYFTQYGPHLPK